MHDWDLICETHGPAVWSTVFRMFNDRQRAWDCYQDVFLEAYRRNASRAVQDWGSLLKWLAVRRALDHLRRERRRSSSLVCSSDAVENAFVHNPPDAAAIHDELAEVVRAELAGIAPKQAEAFWLCAVEEMTYADAAAQMGISPSQVGVLVHRCRAHLRRELPQGSLSSSSQGTSQ